MSLTINANQLLEALEFLGVLPNAINVEDLETELEFEHLPAGTFNHGDARPAGLYCWLTDYPDEGCILLDETPARPLPEPVTAESGNPPEAPEPDEKDHSRAESGSQPERAGQITQPAAAEPAFQPEEGDRFICAACGHSFNCIDETERPRDECPVCGEAEVQRVEDYRAAPLAATQPAGAALTDEQIEVIAIAYNTIPNRARALHYDTAIEFGRMVEAEVVRRAAVGAGADAGSGK